PIAETAKIHFNIGVVLTTQGRFREASAAFERATNLDKYLAIAFYQNGVVNVALEQYESAATCFLDAYLNLRGNMVIDYKQLGLDFKLYSCHVLYNRALCYIELEEMALAMKDLARATREKQVKEHDVIDEAWRNKGRDCTVFTLPQGVLYRPSESKIKDSKKKDYLGNSKVIATVDASEEFAGFKGKSAWQVQLSGPMNIAALEEPRPLTPPNGLQRRATERLAGRRGSGPGVHSIPPMKPLLADLRRAGSHGHRLERNTSTRSNTSSRSQPISSVSSPLGYNNNSGNMIRPELRYRDESSPGAKLRVKCHYVDSRVVLIDSDADLEMLTQKVQEKFKTSRPLKLKYKDEDETLLSITDDEDWITAKTVHSEIHGGLCRMELWCYEEELS
ncbi:hypothetical protein BGZ65_005208, partial [Modicella reniformis]